MKHVIPLAASLLLGYGECTAQVIDSVFDLWAAHGEEFGVSIKPYEGEGYLVFANSYQQTDSLVGFPYVVHITETGNALWNHMFLPDSVDGYLHFSGTDGVDQASGLGYIACGISTLPGTGNYRGFVLRIDQYGNEIWRRYIRFGNLSTVFNVARFTADGGCIVLGYQDTGYGMYSGAIRLDASGNEIWNKIITPPSGGMALGMTALSDGGFILCGKQGQDDGYSPWYGRYNADGDLMWDHVLPPAENPIEFYCIKEYAPNAYVLLGSEKTGYESHRPLFAMIDSTGMLNWLTTIGRFDGWQWLNSFECVPDRGIVGYGFGYDIHPGTFSPSMQGYLVALNADGDSLSALKVSHGFNDDSLAYLGNFQGLQTSSEGQLFAVGWTKSWPWQGWDTQEDLWIYGLGVEDCLFPHCGPPSISTPLSVGDVASDRMSCSPNPVSSGGTLSITLPAIADSGSVSEVSLLIYGVDGRLAAKIPLGPATQRTISVPIGELRPGPYTLMLSDRIAFPYVSRVVVM